MGIDNKSGKHVRRQPSLSFPLHASIQRKLAWWGSCSLMPFSSTSLKLGSSPFACCPFRILTTFVCLSGARKTWRGRREVNERGRMDAGRDPMKRRVRVMAGEKEARAISRQALLVCVCVCVVT